MLSRILARGRNRWLCMAVLGLLLCSAVAACNNLQNPPNQTELFWGVALALN